MLKYYFKTSWRRLHANKGYALLNIAGLSLGLASFLVIAIFVYDELSYDSFHEHKDRIYRVVTNAAWPATAPDFLAVTSRPVADALRTHSGVEEAVRLVPFSPTISYGEGHFRDKQVFYAEPEFLDVFTFPLLEGNEAGALREPYTAVITESTAKSLFREQPALGKEVTFNDSFPVTITGVVADPPPTSHLTFDVLVSYATHDTLRPEPAEPQWLELDRYTYLLVEPEADIDELNRHVQTLPQEHYGAVLQQFGVSMELEMQPLAGIYLYSQRDAEIGPVSDYRVIIAFGTIALFLLLIACINYINMATARSVTRAREVGVRKVLGADRGMLARQFLLGAVMLTTAAMVVALSLTNLILPLLNDLTDKELALSTLLSPPFIALLVALTLGVGVTAGAYPATVISAFVPAPILRGRLESTAQGVSLRKGLVTFQFAVSVTLIMGSLVIFQQTNYMRGHELGFDTENLVMIDARGIPTPQFNAQYEVVKAELVQHPSVTRVTVSSSSPGREPPLLLTVAEGAGEEEGRLAHVVAVDYDYVSTYGLDIVAGRALSEDYESDAYEAALLNERAVERFGWDAPDNALGKWVQFGSERRTVVGVVADYHHLSLHQEIGPMKLLYLPARFNTITVRLRGGDLTNSIADIRRIWQQHFPGQSFLYAFVDERFQEQYRSEEQLATIMGAFAVLAIGLACLGLLGLTAFTSQQRRREIGIRKVLGANSESIVGMLSKDFLKLVLIGFCLGAPIAYVAMNWWLGNFAHRITIGPGIIFLAGAAAVLVAMLPVSYQAFRSASINPVDAINTE